MANKKISSLTSLGAAPATDDIIPITDISDTTGSPQGTTKKVTVANLLANAPDNSTDVTLATVTNNYLTLSGQEITAGIVPVSLGGTGASNLVDARANLGVDASGTDNSTDVTLAAVTNNYLSLSGQEITAGIVPVSLGGTGSGDLATARANLGLGTAATTDSSNYATASHTHSLETDLTDLTIGTKASEDVIKWNGSSWVNGQVSVDVQTPIDAGLTLALRGSDNPHIGAYPNQSFKVTDNPYKSVMVIADEAGNLEFLTKDGANVFVNTPSSRLALAKGFSVQEDGDEPDIEAVTPSGVTYSVISGDSDTKGANGLPTRQGFNYPDIGAYPAPILISGGSIA
jgi:hypothetical protein